MWPFGEESVYECMAESYIPLLNAIGDLWDRTDAESITAYIDEGDNAASRQLAAKLGFVVRGRGRGRSGEPMTVYELRRDVWQRRGG